MDQLADPKPGTLHHVQRDIDRILIDRHRIARRIKELGEEIRCDLDDLDDEGEIMLVPILTGSIIFLADLIRHLPHKIRIGVVTASAYPGATTTSKGAQLAGALPADLEGKHVLIVDDILDSGNTIRLIREEIAKRHPKSLRTCVLLRKTIPSALETPCEYIGFDIPDEFVVGCGLDYNNYYRNLPDICVLKKEAM
ncbi:MAG: hypoxanthine phosphoribosyltransferase [Phycisphaerales bacterium]|nr:MAG: hypoxanthine phosphoribosyltransferase [Phycisphaerales bacterium]